jgi:hypothetical protein
VRILRTLARAGILLLSLLVTGACSLHAGSSSTIDFPRLDPTAVRRPLPEANPSALDAAQMGHLLFVSTVATDPPAGASAAAHLADFTLGQPLYARVDLPLSFDEYGQTYGLDDFVLRVQVSRGDGGWSTVCAHSLPEHLGKSLDVALFADARVLAKLDCTRELVSYLSDYRTEAALQLRLEIEGSSNTVGIRRRALVRDEIDLGISSLPDQLEAFALEDRQLRRQLLQQGAVVAPSRMPDLDDRALAALQSVPGKGESNVLRAVITSAHWQYARDVRSRRPVGRFVLGVATMRGSSGGSPCQLRDVLFVQALGPQGGEEPLRADLLPAAGMGRSVACDGRSGG